LQAVFLSKPFLQFFIGDVAYWVFGKAMAFLWHRGLHAVQPLTHLWVHNNSLAVYEGEYAIMAIFHASGLAIWSVTVTFFWENCWIPWVQALANTMTFSRFHLQFFAAVVAVSCFKVC
jgi:hypothetical protein